MVFTKVALSTPQRGLFPYGREEDAASACGPSNAHRTVSATNSKSNALVPKDLTNAFR